MTIQAGPPQSLPGTARRLTFGSALRLANLAAAVVVSLLIMPFVVHSLGDRLFGIWALLGTFIGYYGLLDLGLSSAVTRSLATAIGTKDEPQCNRVFNTALLIYVLIGAVVLAAGGVAAALCPLFWRQQADAALFGKLILICSAAVALNFPLRVLTGALNAGLRYDRTASLDLLTLLLRAVLTVAVIRAGLQVVGLAWVTLLSMLPSLALYVHFCRREFPFLRLGRRFWRRAAVRELFSYSSFSFIAQVADLLRFQIGPLVVAGALGLALVTHYRVASTMANYFIEIMSALLGVLPALFSRQQSAGDFEGMKRTFLFASKVSIAASSFIAFGLIAFGWPFIARWMGPKYLDAYGCLAVLAAAYMIALWQAPSVNLLYGIARHRVVALLNCAEGAVNLLLSLVLVGRYGLVGVALGALIPMTVSKVLVQPAYVCRVAGIPLAEYLRHAGAALAVVAGALILPGLLAAKVAAPHYPSLLLAGAGSLALFLAPLWLLLFTRGERAALLRLVCPGGGGAGKTAHGAE